ncbi:hypothetical protein KZI27_00665 (plasmid) [Curtobacterium sp. TC1]|uniref:hypothetical protein n=1 Tax=Curtobacterium sp. TC1 TaxID=2862880 RepID=UPI001C9B6FB1|nr:hypothetical protein [Curtobacterium sp. TC1]QZQ53632.1 hypothetical protein KZI27_00665 [Curtobacterium sp. TC1]
MSHYEMDDTADPVRIMTIRRLRKLRCQGQSAADAVGEPLLDDLFENATRER